MANDTSSRGSRSEDSVPFIIEKRFSVALVLTILIQIFLGGWWAATTSAELEVLKEKLHESEISTYKKVEANLELRGVERRLELLERHKVSLNSRIRAMELGLGPVVSSHIVED